MYGLQGPDPTEDNSVFVWGGGPPSHIHLRRVVLGNMWDPGKLSFDSGPAGLAEGLDIVSGSLIFPISEMEMAPGRFMRFLCSKPLIGSSDSVVLCGGHLSVSTGMMGVGRGTQQQWGEARVKEASLEDLVTIHRPPFVIRWFMVTSHYEAHNLCFKHTNM